MRLDHQIEHFDEFLVAKDEFVLETVVLKKRVDGDIRVNFRGGLVGYSQQK